MDRTHLIALATRYVGSDAEDAVQEALIACWRKDIDAPAYVARAVRNQAVNLLRRRKPSVPYPVDIVGDREEADPLLAQEEAEQLHAAIDQLPPRYREIIRLREFEGLTYKEASERIGLRPGILKTYHVEALHRLRQLLDA